MTSRKIAVLAGDGIGPECMSQALKVMNAGTHAEWRTGSEDLN